MLQLNRNIFREELEGEYSSSTFLNITSMDKVNQVMDNLKTMHLKSKGTKMEHVWAIKIHEFERQLKWNALESVALGSERKVTF